MSWNLIFWFYAYGLMFVVLIFAAIGIRKVRSGDLESHLKSMITACNLLLFFVLSYVAKMLFLGRESKEGWSSIDFAILYTHESFIAAMLVTGTRARLLAAKFRERLRQPSGADQALRQSHKRWGKAAILFALCAFVTATAVLWGMYRRGA